MTSTQSTAESYVIPAGGRFILAEQSSAVLDLIRRTVPGGPS